jgi:hypothetical protein
VHLAVAVGSRATLDLSSSVGRPSSSAAEVSEVGRRGYSAGARGAAPHRRVAPVECAFAGRLPPPLACSPAPPPAGIRGTTTSSRSRCRSGRGPRGARRPRLLGALQTPGAGDLRCRGVDPPAPGICGGGAGRSRTPLASGTEGRRRVRRGRRRR